MNNSNLDDLALLKQLDPQDMLGHLHDFPRLIGQAWKAAQALPLPDDYRQVNRVLVLGMGGSAIGGDLVASLAASDLKVPILVHRDYKLPPFAARDTLVIAVSYSGATEETLDAFKEALATEARKLVICSGGPLAELARENNVPVFQFDYPSEPRAALPFSLLPLLNFIGRLGFCRDRSPEVTEAGFVLEQQARHINEKWPTSGNEAKLLAQRLKGNIAVIYGGGITANVARRWKTQLNENGKSWTFWEAFPELDHNAVAGYRFPADLAMRLAVVLLRSNALPERLIQRYLVTGQLLEKAGIPHYFIDGFGIAPLTQMLSLILLGDYVSYYLAILNQVDPTPVESINFLKAQLAQLPLAPQPPAGA